MQKKSAKLLKRFKLLLCVMVFWFAVLLLEVLLLETGILEGICTVGIAGSTAVLIITMVRTSAAWREEEAEMPEKYNEYLLTRYGNKVFSRKVDITKEEKRKNPLFDGHVVTGSAEISGTLAGKRFLYRNLEISDPDVSSSDKDRIRTNQRFRGCSLRWHPDQLRGLDMFWICSAGFEKLTRFRPEKTGYRHMCTLDDGIKLYTKVGLPDIALDMVSSFWHLLVQDFQQPLKAYEMCMIFENGIVEVYVYESEPGKHRIEERMDLIEHLIR